MSDRQVSSGVSIPASRQLLLRQERGTFNSKQIESGWTRARTAKPETAGTARGIRARRQPSRAETTDAWIWPRLATVDRPDPA